MSLGTLSESRIMATVSPTATPNSTPAPDVSKPDKNTPQVQESTTTTTPTPTVTPTKTNENTVTQATLETTTPSTPAASNEPAQKLCGYCMAKSITSLAFQISVVLLVLALSFHFVKKV